MLRRKAITTIYLLIMSMACSNNCILPPNPAETRHFADICSIYPHCWHVDIGWYTPIFMGYTQADRKFWSKQIFNKSMHTCRILWYFCSIKLRDFHWMCFLQNTISDNFTHITLWEMTAAELFYCIIAVLFLRNTQENFTQIPHWNITAAELYWILEELPYGFL